MAPSPTMADLLLLLQKAVQLDEIFRLLENYAAFCLRDYLSSVGDTHMLKLVKVWSNYRDDAMLLSVLIFFFLGIYLTTAYLIVTF
jgi:hypothetical protein